MITRMCPIFFLAVHCVDLLFHTVLLSTHVVGTFVCRKGEMVLSPCNGCSTLILLACCLR